MDTITLKKNQDGQIVEEKQEIIINEIPYNVEEIKTQIIQHAEIIQQLEKLLQAVETFKDSEDTEATLTLTEVAQPLITSSKIQSVRSK